MPHFLSPLIERPEAAFGLVNERTGDAVATTLEPAFDSLARRRGLLGRDGLAPGAALVLAPCAAVHTLFMRFPIDVIFVGRDGRVAKVCRNLRPWRAALAAKAFAAIELAGGGVHRANVDVGDTLRIVPRENLSPARLQSGSCEPAPDSQAHPSAKR